MVKSVYHRFFSFYHLVIFKSGRFISPGHVVMAGVPAETIFSRISVGGHRVPGKSTRISDNVTSVFAKT